MGGSDFVAPASSGALPAPPDAQAARYAAKSSSAMIRPARAMTRPDNPAILSISFLPILFSGVKGVDAAIRKSYHEKAPL
jgi:hypothetical protein